MKSIQNIPYDMHNCNHFNILPLLKYDKYQEPVHQSIVTYTYYQSSTISKLYNPHCPLWPSDYQGQK